MSFSKIYCSNQLNEQSNETILIDRLIVNHGTFLKHIGMCCVNSPQNRDCEIFLALCSVLIISSQIAAYQTRWTVLVSRLTKYRSFSTPITRNLYFGNHNSTNLTTIMRPDLQIGGCFQLLEDQDKRAEQHRIMLTIGIAPT